MNGRDIALASSLVALTGCGGGVISSPAPAALSWSQPEAGAAKKAKHFVYWTLYASCQYPQLQFAKVPLTKKSKATNYYCTKQNGLGYTSGLGVDSSGRLWVLSFNGKYGGNPGLVEVFNVPLKAASVPEYTFVLSGSNGPDALAFDPSGNLWVTSPGNSSVLEYTGPFKKSRTLTPAITLPAPPSVTPSGIAFDKSANIYIANFNSTGTGAIGVLAAPYTGSDYYFLNGVTAPGGLAFDKSGNLYASSNASTHAVVRFNSNDLSNGDTPSIVDPAGLPASSYGAAFAFSSTGDLYAANCGDSGSAGIDVWPLSKKKFTKDLAPSVIYTTADVTQIGCAWGIAIE